jgi:hypothetical protein
MMAKSFHTSSSIKLVSCVSCYLHLLVTYFDAAPLEIMFSVWEQLQHFSNIAISASYTSSSSVPLSPSILYPALQRLITDCPALARIPVLLPDERQPNHHRTWNGRLKRVDVSKCVEWRDNVPEKELAEYASGKIIEEAHNALLWSVDQTDIPHWKLIIVNRRTAIWVADHYVGDGLSGYAFHRRLLRALNSHTAPLLTEAEVNDREWCVKVSMAKPPVHWLSQLDLKPSIIAVLLAYLGCIWYCFLYPFSVRTFYDHSIDAEVPKKLEPFNERRPKTRVNTFRIEEQLQARLLELCREHKTTLTSLLYTMIFVALANDVYPAAKVGIASTIVSARPLTKPPRSKDEVGNVTTAYESWEELNLFREAVANTIDRNSAVAPDNSQFSVNAPRIWELATDYKRKLDHDRFTKNRGLTNTVSMSFVGETNETFYERWHPQVSRFQRGSMRLSSLGLFDPRMEGELEFPDTTEGWRIVETEFSQAIEKSTFGHCGLTFNVAAAQGAGSVVHVTSEYGVLTDDVPDKVVKGILERLKILAETK